MTFAALPAVAMAVLASAVVATLAGLYLLRPTPRPQVVSNVEFWRRAAQRARPLVLAAQRIPILPLFVSMVVSLGLVMVLGDPRPGDGRKGLSVVVVGAGRTLAARDPSGPRTRTALAVALEELRRDTAEGEVVLLRAGLRPRVLSTRTARMTELERALRAALARPDDGPDDLEGALGLAASVLQGAGEGRVVMVTDLPPETVLHASGGRPVTVRSVGEARDTVALTAFGARREPGALGEYLVRAEVTAFTRSPATARLVVRDRDVVLSDERLALGPGEARSVALTGFSSERAELRATLEDVRVQGSEDALARDDSAFGTVEPMASLRVLLVTDGDRYLSQVLALNPMVRVRTISPASLGAVHGSDFDAIVLDRTIPPPGWRHAGVLVYGAVPGRSALVTVGHRLRRPRVTGAGVRHRVVANVRLEQVRVEDARALVPDAGDLVLLRGDRQPLVVTRDRPGERVVALGFGSEGADLVRRVAFPVFIHDALRWLGRQDAVWRSARRPGEVLVAGAGAVVREPSGRVLSPPDGVVEDTSQAGLWRVGTRAVAFHADDAAALPAPTSYRAAPPRRGTLSLTALFAAVALAALLLEWTLLHRGRLQ
ncbi:MAG: hypothetical protein HY909_06520 [Deltaproteobacteria bacterium]|nr:hypothetical protein [Deltaproteobacteria bacterium]